MALKPYGAAATLLLVTPESALPGPPLALCNQKVVRAQAAWEHMRVQGHTVSSPATASTMDSSGLQAPEVRRCPRLCAAAVVPVHKFQGYTFAGRLSSRRSSGRLARASLQTVQKQVLVNEGMTCLREEKNNCRGATIIA